MGPLNATLRVPVALALVAAAGLTLAACGGGEDAKLLPGTTASQINANLDQVRQLVAEEDCIGAENAVAGVSEEIDGLENVDAKLQRALSEGAQRLSVVVGECEESAPEEETEALEEAEAAERRSEEEVEREKSGRGPKRKAEKEVEEEVPSEENEGPTLPPNANGKGEEKGKGGGPVEPPAGGEAPSGGIGPGAPVEGE